jgi:hypothetical protein
MNEHRDFIDDHALFGQLFEIERVFIAILNLAVATREINV